MTVNDRQVSFDDELLIVVDENDNVIGYKNKVECHRGEGILHRAFSIFIFNDRGELLIQKRSAQKPLWPLFWSNSCCSHPRKGEEMAEAAQRRLQEELGFTTPLKHLFTFQYHARYRDVGSEREVCAVYIGKCNGEVRVNPNEIEEWRFVDVETITRELQEHPERYTPWFKLEWERILRDHRAELKF
ncbi:MAG: isopentenyl-diphosphate Delta-isomerase [Calditrichaeota bacterium]|nr:MAG: isopentenyl-diphosphate Delta-isomerase [Calditrichota bacterium]